MSLKLIRIAKLKEFASSRGLEGPVAIGQAIGKKPNQASDLLSGKAPFGEKVARSIEAFAELPDNWLDSATGHAALTAPSGFVVASGGPDNNAEVDLSKALERIAWSISRSQHRGSDALAWVFVSLCKDPDSHLYIEMLERLLSEKQDAPKKVASTAA